MRRQRLAFVLGVASLSLGCALNRSVNKAASPDSNAAVLLVNNYYFNTVRLYVCINDGCEPNFDYDYNTRLLHPFLPPAKQPLSPIAGYYLGETSTAGTKVFVIPREFVGFDYVAPSIFVSDRMTGEYMVTAAIPVQRGDTFLLTVANPLDHSYWLLKFRKRSD